MKRILTYFLWIFFFMFSYSFVGAYYKYSFDSDCYDLGPNAYQYSDTQCACKAWYHFEKLYTWKLKCVEDLNCQSMFWSNSTRDQYGNCSCKSWYMFYTDPNGWNYCIEWKEHCDFLYWSNSLYNDFSKSCGCKYWFELSLDIYWSWYICQSCWAKYWNNSYFDDKVWSCMCKDWFYLKDWICTISEVNFYYYLAEYNWWSDVKVISYDDKKIYNLKLQSTNRNYAIKDYVWKRITINVWTNKKLDKWDVFKLEYKNDVTWIILKILNVSEVKNNYYKDYCKKMYWEYSYLWTKNNCECKNWYELNSEETECIWKSIRNTNLYPTYYNNDNNSTNTNSIFDTSFLNKK